MIRVVLSSPEKCDEKMFENITASEVAGYAVGALLLSATISAPKIDSFISSSQRSSLGMCKRCGGVNRIACRKCKGSGLIKQGGPLTLTPILDNKSKSVSCSNCGGRGCFSCPQCSDLSQV